MVTTAQTHTRMPLPPSHTPASRTHLLYIHAPRQLLHSRLLGHGWRRCCVECVEYAVHLDTHGRHLLVPLHQLLQAVLKVYERLHLWQRVCMSGGSHRSSPTNSQQHAPGVCTCHAPWQHSTHAVGGKETPWPASRVLQLAQALKPRSRRAGPHTHTHSAAQAAACQDWLVALSVCHPSPGQCAH